jgi:polyisoprenoid-binding protein YceI
MMRHKLPTSITALALLAFASSAFAADYALDTAHSKVGFSVAHLVISSVDGRFSDFAGTVSYDAEDITKTSVSVSIKTASINTDNEKRDGHLRSPDFFDAEKFPEITFSGDKVVKKDKGHVVVGKLNMHGVEKTIELPFEIKGPINSRGKGLIAIQAHMTLGRKDFGLTWSKTMETGGLVVGDEVTIELILEATEQKEAAEQK